MPDLENHQYTCHILYCEISNNVTWEIFGKLFMCRFHCRGYTCETFKATSTVQLHFLLLHLQWYLEIGLAIGNSRYELPWVSSDLWHYENLLMMVPSLALACCRIPDSHDATLLLCHTIAAQAIWHLWEMYLFDCEL